MPPVRHYVRTCSPGAGGTAAMPTRREAARGLRPPPSGLPERLRKGRLAAVFTPPRLVYVPLTSLLTSLRKRFHAKEGGRVSTPSASTVLRAFEVLALFMDRKVLSASQT